MGWMRFDGTASTTRTRAGGFSVWPFRLGPARCIHRAPPCRPIIRLSPLAAGMAPRSTSCPFAPIASWTLRRRWRSRALALIRSRHPEAIRVHSISALVWLFRVRRAFGRYWRCDASLTGSGILCERLYRLRRLVTRCHASTLSRIAATVPFSDVSTDGTRGWDPCALRR